MNPASCKVYSATFNAQQDCFCVATDMGIRLFNTHPAVLLRSFSREKVGGVKVCSILHRSNIIVIVGGGSYAKFPSNTVMVWDDKQQEFILEVISSKVGIARTLLETALVVCVYVELVHFKSNVNLTVTGGPILNVLLAYSKLIVLQEKRIHVFQFPTPCKLLRTEEIRFNPTGLAAVSCDFNCTTQMLAYPGFKAIHVHFQIGSVQLANLNNMSEYASLSPRGVDAHLTEITQLALNNQATLLATGSTKGTVIRIFDANSAVTRCLMEFRRGADPCSLHCLKFSPCSSFLAVSSDKGTIHIFAVRDSDDTKRGILHKVGLSKGEKRSSAQISLEPRVLSCGFIKASSSSMQSIVAICQDGTYHSFRFSFGEDGCAKREGFDQIMQLGDEQEFWTKSF
uniref:WD repeat domain phosphoinositide-interacting protein 4 n=1 Tax=Angiostrongylus cantonensis TaxID=6313 RepID=A0A158PB59_ANGCA